MRDDLPNAGAEKGRSALAAIVALWVANVPLGMWLARGYVQAARGTVAGFLGWAMGLWVLAVGVALVLLPGLAGALALARRWRRAAMVWALVWCMIAVGLLWLDGTVYGLTRLHALGAEARAALVEPDAAHGIGIGATTVVWGLVGLALLAIGEAATLAGLVLAARRTGILARLGGAGRRVPRLLRWGIVGAVTLPPLAVALSEPRGPLLEVGRHFLIPLAPRRRVRSARLDGLNDTLRRVAAERRQPPEGAPLPVAAPKDPRPTDRPSILFLSIDSLRADVVTPEAMPHLAALERECVVARRHYAESNTTHHSLFAALTGLHPLWYGRARQESATPVPLAVLRAAGYELHAVASARIEWVGMGEAVVPRRLFATYEAIESHPVHRDAGVAERLLAIAREADGPFLAIGLFTATHFNYSYPPDAEHFRPVAPAAVRALSAEALRGQRDGLWNRYRNAARFVDGVVGKLLDALRRDGLLERLIVVVAADHGEAFLEDGVICHGNSFHDVQIRIPFMVRHPGGHGREVAGLTQNADFFPSLFAEMGIAPSALGLPGYRTLRPEPDEARPWAVASMSAPHTPVDYLLVTDRLRCRFWLNVEPAGRLLIEARELTAPDRGPEAAAAVADWLDRQGIRK